MNKCIFIGRLTKDVEVKTIGSTTVANFTLAVDRKFKKDGQPTADFLNFVAFEKTAEIMEKYLAKGSQIGVECRVQTRNFEDKQGTKHYVTEFVVESFTFCGGKAEGGSAKATKKEAEEDFEL